MEPTFNEEQIARELSKMRIHQQLAFGAACCERMLPNYVSFVREVNWGDLAQVRCALDVVWDASMGTQQGEPILQQMRTKCEQCAPDSDDFCSLYTSSAQDAAFAVCSLLDFLLDGNPDHIASVARFSTDSIDLIVQEREKMDPRDPSREQRILEHPLMQQELLRQRRDIADAVKISAADRAALIALRTRAQRESNLMLA